MNKKFLLGTVAVVVTAAGAFGVSALTDSQMQETYGQDGVETDVDADVDIDTNRLVGSDELEDIVLSQVEGKIDEIELEYDDGHLFFEVEVKNSKGRDADVYVDAYSGEVLKVDYDDDGRKDDDRDDDRKGNKNDDQKETEQKQATENSNNSNEQTDQNKTETKDLTAEKPSSEKTEEKKQENTQKKQNQAEKEQPKEVKSTSDNKSEFIGKEKAMEIARGVYDGPAPLDDFELDEDDGRYVYEIEFEKDDDDDEDEEEVEIEIDAKTGEVLKVEYDD